MKLLIALTAYTAGIITALAAGHHYTTPPHPGRPQGRTERLAELDRIRLETRPGHHPTTHQATRRGDFLLTALQESDRTHRHPGPAIATPTAAERLLEEDRIRRERWADSWPPRSSSLDP